MTDKPETPHCPNRDHDVRIYPYARIINGVLMGRCFRAVCICGAASDACDTYSEAAKTGFDHLDYQLQDHS